MRRAEPPCALPPQKEVSVAGAGAPREAHGAAALVVCGELFSALAAFVVLS